MLFQDPNVPRDAAVARDAAMARSRWRAARAVLGLLGAMAALGAACSDDEPVGGECVGSGGPVAGSPDAHCVAEDGSEIRVTPPQGNFRVDLAQREPIVFFAGGIGVVLLGRSRVKFPAWRGILATFASADSHPKFHLLIAAPDAGETIEFQPVLIAERPRHFGHMAIDETFRILA